MSHRQRWTVLAALCAVALLAQAGVPRDFHRVLAVLQPEHRDRLEAQARLWAGWTPVQREAFRERAIAWDAQPHPARGERRGTWRAWTALTASERERLRAERDRVAQLPKAEQEALRARFAALDASTQRGWMLGPVLGADYIRLQPLLAQVPAAQHDALLRTLRAMTPVQRADLGVLVQRTPPARRDALRRELVSTSAGNRDAWLQSSLER